MISLSRGLGSVFLASLFIFQTCAVAEITDCEKPTTVGFRVLLFGDGKKASVWYPSASSESDFSYTPGRPTKIANGGVPATCGPYPVILFSHGFGGCSIQSLAYTESMARHGYVVVAPDHADARCGGQWPSSTGGLKPTVPFRQPKKWNDKTYLDRRDDLLGALSALYDDTKLGPISDKDRIGVSGHSLGGYAAAGLVGGWTSWLDRRFKAALLFSPLIGPFLVHGRVPALSAPVMYQGGEFDSLITPEVKRKGGAYEKTKPPKFFLELPKASHLAWTMMSCEKHMTPSECESTVRNVALTGSYALSFFDRYLKNSISESVLIGAPDLTSFRCELEQGQRCQSVQRESSVKKFSPLKKLRNALKAKRKQKASK